MLTTLTDIDRLRRLTARGDVTAAQALFTVALRTGDDRLAAEAAPVVLNSNSLHEDTQAVLAFALRTGADQLATEAAQTVLHDRGVPFADTDGLACRWGPELEPLWDGHRVLVTRGCNDYQGHFEVWSWDGNKFWFREWSWGSCGGCDEYENWYEYDDVNDDSAVDERIRDDIERGATDYTPLELNTYVDRLFGADATRYMAVVARHILYETSLETVQDSWTPLTSYLVDFETEPEPEPEPAEPPPKPPKTDNHPF